MTRPKAICGGEFTAHRYRRIASTKGKPCWKCIDCPSFTYNPAHLVGNKARCYHCDTLFKITFEKLRYAKLKCGQNLEECKDNLVESMALTPEEQVGQTQLQTLLAKVYGEQGEDDEPANIREMERKLVEDAIRSDSEQEQGG